MAQWQTSITRQPPKTKAELRQMLAEAVRNTQASANRGPKHLPQPKKAPPSIESAGCIGD
jgi:hypothetical protein